MTNIKIGGAERFSLVDYPNKVAAVVFMQGCPWRCPFCHNHHLQDCAASTDFVWEKFMAFLQKRVGVLDAVVFSGGEPLLQPLALQEKMTEVKQLGYQIGLHTGGCSPEAFAKVLPLVDWVGFDIKAPFVEAHYQRAMGAKTPLTNVLQSLDLLLSSGKDYETRTTCDPRLLSTADIYAIADSLKDRGVTAYYLQKYRPIPSDNESTESMCESFFKDKALLEYLRDNFKTFDIRA